MRVWDIPAKYGKVFTRQSPINPRRPLWRKAIAAAGLVVVLGCQPINNYAMNKMADVIARGGATFHQDNDPQLIREALPFTLKLIEGLLDEAPNHEGLLLRACSAYTEYAYGFVLDDADRAEEENFPFSQKQRLRAKKLFLRARDYGLRGLELRHSGFRQQLEADPGAAVAGLNPADVAFAYWTGASWGAAISNGKDDQSLVAQQPQVEALLDCALELNESFEGGSIHQALITYEMVRRGASGDPGDRARRHYARALELSEGHQAGPHVAYAESVLIPEQKRDEFKRVIEAALAVDSDAVPEWRVVNLVMQERASWLLSRIDDLFVPALPPDPASPPAAAK